MSVAVPQMTTAQRLRAFEDSVCPNAPRPYGGKIERGIGSPFSRLPAEQRQHHAALESLIEAEAECSAAAKIHLEAQQKCEAARKAVERTAGHIVVEQA